MQCNKCGRHIGEGLGTQGNFIYCERVLDTGEQITLGYLWKRFTICTSCWDNLVMPHLNIDFMGQGNI